MDPYKVLGVTPQTSDDDIKRAYRELARKYHPDNYVNNPLADLAEARMKEINEAYDMIMNERNAAKNGGASQSQQGQRYYQTNRRGKAARESMRRFEMRSIPVTSAWQKIFWDAVLRGMLSGIF